MNQEVITRILQAYGVEYTRVLAPQKGYRNTSYPVVTPGGMLNLILYKTEPGIIARIRRTHAVSNFVHTQGGLPVRYPYTHRLIRLKTETGVQKYGGLYTYLPGHTIPWEAYTMAHIKALGKAMSDLHAVLARFDAKNLPHVADESLAPNHRMLRYFADAQVARALQQKLGLAIAQADFSSWLTATKKLPNPQALHMDFVRGNILFNNNAAITGILDFEKTARGHKLYDVARTLAFLLVDCKYKSEPQVRKYFLQSGYVKRGASSLADINIGGHSLLETLVNFFLLYDFYKFLRHNPYESLPHNEHFVRTKAMLLKRGIITPA